MTPRDALLGLALRATQAGTPAHAAVDLVFAGIKAAGDDGEHWAEDGERLGLIEWLIRAGISLEWRALRELVLRILGLAVPVGDRFDFDPTKLPELISAGDAMATRVASDAGPLRRGQIAAWQRGMLNVALQLSLKDDVVQAAIARALARMNAHYAAHGLALVRNGLVRHYQQPIIAMLASGAFDGQNPTHVARDLGRRFAAGDYNWERLARSETAWAHGTGKLQLMQEQGIVEFDYVTADDDKVSKICRHLEAGSPYLVAAGRPIPMRDSHPNCRCTLLPRLPP